MPATPPAAPAEASPRGLFKQPSPRTLGQRLRSLASLALGLVLTLGLALGTSGCVSTGLPIASASPTPVRESWPGRVTSMPRRPRCGRVACQSRNATRATGTRSKKIPMSW